MKRPMVFSRDSALRENERRIVPQPPPYHSAIDFANHNRGSPLWLANLEKQAVSSKNKAIRAYLFRFFPHALVNIPDATLHFLSTMTHYTRRKQQKIIQSLSYLVKDSWFPEVQAIFTAWLALVMVFFLLGYYFNKAPFTWHGLSLNTWVSIFSTIMKSLLLFTISGCLSQWKYISFSERRRKLIDFDLYDGASRGPNGSVALLWSMQFKSLASIGAVITILSLGLDPFVQQVIALGEISRPDSSTAIARVIRYAEGTQLKANSRLNSRDSSLQSAIFAGLIGTEDSILQQMEFRCAGTRCSWQPFLSLGVCSSCSNVSHLLERATPKANNRTLQWVQFVNDKQVDGTTTSEVRTFGLPNGLYLEEYGNSKLDLVSFGTSNRSETLTFKRNETLLWSLTVIRRVQFNPPSSTADFMALECGLSYCVQNITSMVVNATLSEEVNPLPVVLSPGSFRPESSDSDPSPGSLWTSHNYSRTELQLKWGNEFFNLSQVAINAIGYSMKSLFVMDGGRKLGATGFYIDLVPVEKRAEDESKEPDQDNGATINRPWSMQQIYSQNMTAIFEALASSMSINFRTKNTNRTLVRGTILVTVYKVRWGWIALPFMSVLGGTGFLLVTMSYSHIHHLPLWKSSSLSILKVGRQMGDIFTHEESIGEMERKAEKMHIGLREKKQPLMDDSESTRGLRSPENYELHSPISLPTPHLPNDGNSFISLPLNADPTPGNIAQRISWEEEDVGSPATRP
ncbi:hypothetical protein K469DRAFT_685136 [Zopfia rhizophila CBS 207.26]|uniref:Uncharacterized protein n=1 Tax=Zopfia rhizophila CBS 207.26 TaxID=1314779 RepID=A0A6A6D9H7_9PEZI|nr:hypothetical protein K469DRAFT_685136 [Zopfia rhizophila CBS 207.26]